MNKYLLSACVAAGAFAASAAVTLQPSEVIFPVATLTHTGNSLDVNIAMNIADMNVRSNQALLITPYLVNQTDTVAMPSVGVYGRRRYIHYKRNDAQNMISGPSEIVVKASEAPAAMDYSATVDYQPWMNGAQLYIDRKVYGCCKDILVRQTDMAGTFNETLPFVPVFAYVQPVAVGDKQRSEEGSAMIDFAADQTEIDPEFRKNKIEIAKIKGVIDSMRADKDFTITGIWLKGYASPESPYEHNAELAKGRTESLKKYIDALYPSINESIFTTSYEPEDWDGLRKKVEASNISNKKGILAIIDSGIAPDAKEAKLKKEYPEQWKKMFNEWFSSLRRTDYRVNYNVRSFSDVKEIKKLVKTAPQKLSPNEFYLAAQTYAPGTDEYNAIFETAAQYNPGDEISQLNAANAAMSRGDLTLAAQHLSKAGNSKEANYARGILAALQGDYSTAKNLIEAAQRAGVKEADETLRSLEKAF